MTSKGSSTWMLSTPMCGGLVGSVARHRSCRAPLGRCPRYPWEPHHLARGREFWEATGCRCRSAVYFNSGVMVIDPAAWRALEISKQVQALVAESGLSDQVHGGL